MNQKAFDTKQRAEELLNEAISIWKQGDHNDQLENLKTDPVFHLLMSAVACQANEIDNDIERIKDDVLREYASMLTPYNAGHATPASVAINIMPAQGNGEVDLNSSSAFTLSESDFKFVPVMHTRALAWKVKSISRIDGRRWEVCFGFEVPVSDLSLASFAINNQKFKDVKVSVKGKELPLIRPWEYSELPLADCFSYDAYSFNKETVFDPSMDILDIFARSDLRIYFIRSGEDAVLPVEGGSLDLKMVFEFEGIEPDFVLDKSMIILNPVVIANLELNEAHLDKANPIVRISDDENVTGIHNRQLVHVLAPNRDQMYADADIYIRKVAADRFNKSTLLHTLASLIEKIHTDYYAFIELDVANGEQMLNELSTLFSKMIKLLKNISGEMFRGTYVMLGGPRIEDSISISLKYLTTSGSATTDILSKPFSFQAPGGLDGDTTRVISDPIFGTDETESAAALNDIVRYYVQTNDRIITPHDIKSFCYKELNLRYGILPTYIADISVKPEIAENSDFCGNGSGYVIKVSVKLTASPFIKRSFEPKIPQAETLLEKMMQVRSANIYPISVKIELN